MDSGLPLRSSPKPIASPEHRSCPVNCRRWARVNFRTWAKASCQNQPPETLFDQPATAQTNAIAGLACSSPIQVAAAALVVLRHMRSYMQLPYRAHKVLRVVGLVGAEGNAPGAPLLLLLQHQQRGIAFRVNHRRASPSRRQSARCGSPPGHGPDSSASTLYRSSSYITGHRDRSWTDASCYSASGHGSSSRRQVRRRPSGESSSALPTPESACRPR